MKKFIKDVVVFLLPVLACAMFIGVFYLVAYDIGEFKDLEKNILAQRENETIVLGLGYNEQTKYYKFVNADYYKADVIALGTSRAMQFKDYYFESEFYNCGGGVSGNYNEYVNFLENLSYIPQFIILDLDAWVFNDAWNNSAYDYEKFLEISLDERDNASMLKSIIQDYVDGKWTFGTLDNYPDNIGFNGRIKNNGFMADGSYYYGSVYVSETRPNERLEDTFTRIETGTNRFQYGEHIDYDTIVQLENLLSYCADKGIYVVGFMAPFAPSVCQAMELNGNYGYIKELNPSIEKIFEKYQFEYYDYFNGSYLGATDDWFVDGFHGSEVLYGLMVQDMINNGSKLSEYIDEKELSDLIETAYSELVFKMPR